MSTWLPEIEGWTKAAGAAVAVVMALLVPIRSWIIEDRRYRSETLQAVAAASRNTIAGVTASSSLLADSLALSRLSEAVNRLAVALERVTEAEDRRHKDRLSRALERLLGTGDGEPSKPGPDRAPSPHAPAGRPPPSLLCEDNQQHERERRRDDGRPPSAR